MTIWLAAKKQLEMVTYLKYEVLENSQSKNNPNESKGITYKLQESIAAVHSTWYTLKLMEETGMIYLADNSIWKNLIGYEDKIFLGKG